MNRTKSDVQGVAPRTSDSDVLAAVTKMLEEGTSNLGASVTREFGAQLNANRHLDEGTPERAYWHAGYVAAMKTVLNKIRERVTDWPAGDTDR
jgi:hypothetical protein